MKQIPEPSAREEAIKLLEEIKRERDIKGVEEPQAVSLKGYSIFSRAGNCCGGDDSVT